MDGMSLIPSESASFPDLVGQRHGYLPPNVRHRSRRSHKEATRPSHPTLSNSLEENRAVAQSETEIGQPGVSIEPLDRIDTLKEPAAHEPRVEQFELPTNAPAELEPLEEVVALTNAPADAESPERLKLPKTKVSEPSYSIRAALPIPPQRSSAQMRSKIQTQEIAAPAPTSIPATRPRTPVRGLAIAHPPPIVSEKPTSKWSSHFPLRNLPRRRLVRLVRFIACEVMVVGVLILGMAFGFSHRTTDDPLSLFLKILAVVAAVAAVVVPVLFFGLPEEFPRSER